MAFDFFGVICSEVAPIWLERYFDKEAAIAIKADIVAAADRGEISQADMFSRLSTLTTLPSAQVESEWLACAIIDREMLQLVREVAGRARLALLTNAPAPFVRQLLGMSGIEPLFEAVLVSSELGFAKPDRRIYEALVAVLKVSAADVLLIDDNSSNVAGARAVGMGAILFESCERLRLAMA